MAHWTILVLAILAFVGEISAQLSDSREELLNWCLKSQNHKSKPGKQTSLHKQCLPWKEHSCCTEEVTVAIHEQNMYNFTYDHCFNQSQRRMSSRCRRHFTQDNCFYECEPHIGLWVVKTNRKISSERFYKVPLCASYCEAWFQDCKEDYTCAYNWPRDFKFSKGYNFCKEGSECLTFSQIYGTAKNFCENVWDHSWVYSPDDKPCMHVWFNESSENPNRRVAEHYINERFGTGGVSKNTLNALYCFALGLWTLALNRNFPHL